MENVMIAILNPYDKVLAFMDNDAPKALHYYDDELHTYVKGSAATFSFSASAKHEDAQHLVEGNKLSFVYNNKDYYFNIMKVEKDEYTVTITAFSLHFELLNDTLDAYKASHAMIFAEYMKQFDTGRIVTIGINELSSDFYDVAVIHEFSEETLLSRLFTLADLFNAELEFVSVLSSNYSLEDLIVNIYRKHDSKHQGIGKDRRDITLRYGKEISGIKKTSDITELFTAIRPSGNDGLSLMSKEITVKDENGEIEYYTKQDSQDIFAPQAKERFPSLRTKKNGYIYARKEYDTSDGTVLFYRALEDLKEGCVPKVTYEIEGSFDTEVGDTVSVEDTEFNPPLYLSVRVTEQVVSFTDPSRNKSTVSNVKELQSQISPELLKRMQALVDANKAYTCSIVTDNGIVFKNGAGTTLLTASVMDGGSDVTGDFNIQWYKDGAVVAAGETLEVSAADVDDKAVYRFEALLNGAVKGSYEVTVVNVSDGADGAPGKDGTDGKDGVDGEPGKDGEDGMDAILYEMIVDAAAIKYTPSENTYTSITVESYKKVGNNSTPYEAYFVIELLERSWYEDTQAHGLQGTSSFSYTPPTDRIVAAVRISMYEGDPESTALLRQQIIPVVSDGVDGIDGADGKDGQNGVDGANGADATAYKMLVSTASIAKNASGTYKQTSITVQGRKQTGTGAYSSYACRFKIETTTSSNLSSATWTSRYTSSSNVSSYTYTIPSGITGIRCSMYLAGGTTTLLDQVIIPIVTDGADGADGADANLTPTLLASAKTLASGGSFSVSGVKDLLLLEVANSSERSRRLELFIKGVNATRNIHIAYDSSAELYITITVTWSGSTATVKCTRFYATGNWSSGTSQLYYVYTL